MNLFEWDFSPPASAPIGDHDVRLASEHLTGKRVALLVCGGIAAMKTPGLARALRRRGAEVVAFCSEEALRYVGSEALEWATCHPLVTRLTWRAEHLSDGARFDVHLVAPATYNTIGKMAHGIADTVVASVLASALGRLARGETEILVASTMHGSMHHGILTDNCRALAARGVRFVTPRDDYGKHNLPDDEVIAAAVCRAVSKSPLAGKKILASLGPVPFPLDASRAIRRSFEGMLLTGIHGELLLRGADSMLVLEGFDTRPETWMPMDLAQTSGEHESLLLARAALRPEFGIFSSDENLPSEKTNGTGFEIAKDLINRIHRASPTTVEVILESGDNVSREELLQTARGKLDRFPLVVASRGEEIAGDFPAAYLVTPTGDKRFEGFRSIATAVADRLEDFCRSA